MKISYEPDQMKGAPFCCGCLRLRIRLTKNGRTNNVIAGVSTHALILYTQPTFQAFFYILSFHKPIKFRAPDGSIGPRTIPETSNTFDFD